MMLITLNGSPREVGDGLTLATLLAHEQLQGRRVAIELNGEIVPRSRHAQQPVQAGDRVEIVQAIGGG
jgi:sulfur carrier protein